MKHSAPVSLIEGVKGRYVTGIIFLAITFIFSMGTIIGINIANSAIVSALSDAAGMWVLMLFPEIVSVTAWPWVTAFVSIATLVALCVLLARNRKQVKALEATETAATPA